MRTILIAVTLVLLLMAVLPCQAEEVNVEAIANALFFSRIGIECGMQELAKEIETVRKMKNPKSYDVDKAHDVVVERAWRCVDKLTEGVPLQGRRTGP